jgi:hypothetical protein
MRYLSLKDLSTEEFRRLTSVKPLTLTHMSILHLQLGTS